MVKKRPWYSLRSPQLSYRHPMCSHPRNNRNHPSWETTFYERAERLP